MKLFTKIIIALSILVGVFLVGFAMGFSYVAGDATEAFQPETWRTFFNELRSF